MKNLPFILLPKEALRKWLRAREEYISWLYYPHAGYYSKAGGGRWRLTAHALPAFPPAPKYGPWDWGEDLHD